MTAEKGADIILGKSLPPSSAKTWIDPEWATRQRKDDPKRAI